MVHFCLRVFFPSLGSPMFSPERRESPPSSSTVLGFPGIVVGLSSGVQLTGKMRVVLSPSRFDVGDCLSDAPRNRFWVGFITVEGEA